MSKDDLPKLKSLTKKKNILNMRKLLPKIEIQDIIKTAQSNSSRNYERPQYPNMASNLWVEYQIEHL